MLPNRTPFPLLQRPIVWLPGIFSAPFATETSLIDPLPHQRVDVYETMLQQSPLRFLMADDAGAGETIMAGLYVREMLSRG